MKKIIYILGSTLIFLPFFSHAEAEMDKSLFSTKTKMINHYVDYGITEFIIDLEFSGQKEEIAYWKVRSYCDDKMKIQLTLSSKNDCGKAVKMDSLKDNSFSFLFDNEDSKLKTFAVKLKAYDKNGKWLHTEKESFRWK